MKYTSRNIILCALLCAYNIAQAQWTEIIHPAPAASFYTYLSQPGRTFSQLTDTLNALADQTDTAEGGALDQLKAFKQIWAGRVSANDTEAK